MIWATVIDVAICTALLVALVGFCTVAHVALMGREP